MNEKYYKVSESELRELLYSYFKLLALENANVTKWQGYIYAIQTYLKKYKVASLYDLVNKEIFQEESYEEIR